MCLVMCGLISGQARSEVQDEKRFLRSLKEKQEADMKAFVSQQKADLRSTKNLYRKVQ